MRKRDRRQFLQESGLVLGFAALNPQMNPAAYARILSAGNNSSPAKNLPPLFNTNLQTAIGLGDETPGIVDQYGQLDSRHARISLDIGATPLGSSDFHWSQSLADGYLPIVDTEVRSSQGSVRWTAYASNAADTNGECLEFLKAGLPLRIHLWFPFTTRIEVSNGMVTSGDQILALFPAAASVKVSQAKYNLMTPERETWSFSKPPWSPIISRLSPRTIARHRSRVRERQSIVPFSPLALQLSSATGQNLSRCPWFNFAQAWSGRHPKPDANAYAVDGERRLERCQHG